MLCSRACALASSLTNLHSLRADAKPASTGQLPSGVLQDPEDMTENSWPMPVWFGPMTKNLFAGLSAAIAWAAVLPEYS